jgi:hypothetical protein
MRLQFFLPFFSTDRFQKPEKLSRKNWTALSEFQLKNRITAVYTKSTEFLLGKTLTMLAELILQMKFYSFM